MLICDVDLNYKVNNRQSPIHILLEKEKPNVDLLDYIFGKSKENGILIDEINGDGLTPLLFLCLNHEGRIKNQDDVLEVFLKHKKKVNFLAKVNSTDKTVFHLLVENIMCTRKSVDLLQQYGMVDLDLDISEIFHTVIYSSNCLSLL